MSCYEDRDRKIIPRWCEFNTTLQLNELSCVTAPTRRKVLEEPFFAVRLRDWRDHRTLSYAADLVSSSIVLAKESEVTDAARFVVERAPKSFQTAMALARHVLGIRREGDGRLPQTHELSLEMVRQRVHMVRVNLHTQPRNAFMWADLARSYETLGCPNQAEKAICMALRLAPHNRFVLRSAARLFVHQNNYGRGHSILQQSPGVRNDPWLLAAEIAVASAAGRVSRIIKPARRIVKEGRFRPFHTSELASALGTLELEAGNIKGAKRLLRASLVDPSENAIAQAAWIARTSHILDVPKPILNEGQSWEARAWNCFRAGDWPNTVLFAKWWLNDQPFSSRPAIFGSYVAAICEAKFEESADIARKGLIANPNDFTLINNVSFALAQLNQGEEARKVFVRIVPSTLTPEKRVVWLATRGLLAYRAGKPQEGKSSYLEAIAETERGQDVRRRALALSFLALEELRLSTPEAEAYRRRALSLTSLPLDLQPLIRRVAAMGGRSMS